MPSSSGRIPAWHGAPNDAVLVLEVHTGPEQAFPSAHPYYLGHAPFAAAE